MALSARDDYASTVGRGLIDMIVRSMVRGTASNGGSTHPPEVWAKNLRMYIRDMGGDVSVMVGTLQNTYGRSAEKPTDKHRLKRLAHARQTLRVYIDEIEIRTGNHIEQGPRKAGRPRGYGKGYSVSQVKSGRFRVVLTSRDFGRGKQIGLVGTRTQAHNLGRETVSELRAAQASGAPSV